MKLIKLTMNAFSTFHQLTTIDFENINGLFLISGPTGSGKTTIFDAITFALYGQASGSERNQSHLRSDYAQVKEETYVELIFLLHQKTYTVRRSPAYARKGYKTIKQATAYLTCDEQTIEGIKEVNQKINQIMGVDIQQFKQIVMIAQGEFTKLIYADSENREKVLRHIFHTEPLVRFEELLREKTKMLKEQYQNSMQQLNSQFILLKLSDDFMQSHKEFHPAYIEEAIDANKKIYEDYQLVQVEYELKEKEYQQLSQNYYQQQQINENIKHYLHIDQEYQQHCLKAEEMKVKKDELDKIRKIQSQQTLIYQDQSLQNNIQQNQQEYQKTLVQEKQFLQQYEKVSQEHQTLPQLEQQKEQYQLEIHQLQEKIKQSEDYQKMSHEYQVHQKEYTHTKQQYDDLKQKHQAFIKRMERDQENVQKLPSLQLQLQQSDQLVKETNQRRTMIHELSDLYDQYKDLQDKHYELSQIYQQRNEIYQSLFIQYQKEDESFKRQQAGILAQNLKEGDPCPVCGSIHHPQIAKISSQVLNAHELDLLSIQVEHAKKAQDEAYQEVLSHNERLQTVKSKIDVYKQQLNIQEELSKQVFILLLSDIMQMIQGREKVYQKQYTEVGYLKKIQQSLEKDKDVQTKNEQQLEKLLDHCHELEKKMTGYQTQMETFHITQTSQQLTRELKEKTEALKMLQQNIQNIQESYQKIKQRQTWIQSQKEHLLQEKEHLQEQYQDIHQQLIDFQTQYFKDVEEYQKYYEELKTIYQREEELQNYEVKSQTLVQQLQQYHKYHNQDIVDLTSMKNDLNALEIKQKEISQQAHEKQFTYQQNEQIISQVKKIYQKNQDIFKQYMLYQDLTDYTSGKSSKISFERYVLSAYFDHILEYANKELLKMSQGRFAMYRKLETKGAKQQGLDLSVMDYETGILRDIQSLSGGESFKAALSLALGLSAMIQSYAGGIELNTLFIDEGFGTLDQESLNQALNVLLDLKNDQKNIGIISHVGELQERISHQIHVEKGKDGSYLHIEMRE